jgi:hypothetical protein
VTNCTSSGTSVGIYTQSVSSLAPSTLIYFRGYAVNAYGTGYSSDSSTTTLSNGTTTLTTGVDPLAVTILPGGSPTFIDSFTFQTTNGTDTISALVIGIDNASSTSLLEITNDTGSIVYGSVSNPIGLTVPVTLSTNILNATTVTTQYKIRITPKALVNLPAGDQGVLYPITAKVNSWTSSNNKTGTDTAGAVVSINNLAPTAQGDIANVWTARTSAVDNNWNSVVYASSTFVAVSDTGNGNRVMTSLDGINWTSRTSAANSSWKSVTYGNGLFVAVAPSLFGKGVMISPDGITWTTSTAASDNDWTSVTYGNGIFVAVAKSGRGDRVMTSSDGVLWSRRSSAADNNWTSVTYGNGVFVAVASSGTGNRVMTSFDGITWTLRASSADNQWTSVTYGNGLFVAVASSGNGNRVMTSSDGITWTSRSSAANNNWTSVASTYGLFVAVANSGAGNRVMASSDGITWTTRVTPIDNDWKSVVYGNGTFTAVANYFLNNLVMTSSKEAPTITPGNGQVIINYITSSDTSVTSMIVLRSVSPITDIPVNGTSYSLGDTVGASTVACIDNTITPSSADSCTITGLTNGTIYYYKLFARNSIGGYSSGVTPVGSLATSNSSASIDQSNYQVFASSSTYLPGSPLAAQNTTATLTNFGDAFRIRMAYHVASSSLGIGGKSLKLQYAVKSGTCDIGFSGETYRDITSISPISFYDVSELVNGSALGSQVDLTHGSDTMINQSFVDQSTFFYEFPSFCCCRTRCEV